MCETVRSTPDRCNGESAKLWQSKYKVLSSSTTVRGVNQCSFVKVSKGCCISFDISAPLHYDMSSAIVDDLDEAARRAQRELLEGGGGEDAMSQEEREVRAAMMVEGVCTL